MRSVWQVFRPRGLCEDTHEDSQHRGYPVDEVKNAFKKFDANTDGHLDRNEFAQLVKACGSGSEQEAAAFFQKGDTDGDGKLDYQELVKLLFPQSAMALQKLQKTFSNLNDVKTAFKRYDADGDGHVSKQELQQVMQGFSGAEVEAIFALGDKDQSGGIDIQEFISLMLPSGPATIARLSQNFRSVANVKDSFKKFDADGDGQINRNELKNAMKLNDADLDIVFALGDLDGDAGTGRGHEEHEDESATRKPTPSLPPRTPTPTVR